MAKAYELMLLELKQKKIICVIYLLVFIFAHLAILMENIFYIRITDIEGSFIAMIIANNALIFSIYGLNKPIYKDLGIKPIHFLQSMLMMTGLTFVINLIVWVKYLEYVISMQNKSPTAFGTIAIIYAFLWFFSLFIRYMKKYSKHYTTIVKNISKEERKTINPSIVKVHNIEKVVHLSYPFLLMSAVWSKILPEFFQIPLTILAVILAISFFLSITYFLLILIPREDSLE